MEPLPDAFTAELQPPQEAQARQDASAVEEAAPPPQDGVQPMELQPEEPAPERPAEGE